MNYPLMSDGMDGTQQMIDGYLIGYAIGLLGSAAAGLIYVEYRLTRLLWKEIRQWRSK